VSLRADWLQHLHAFRRRELQAILGQCPERQFRRGLELGAGDGYQSSILSRYVQRLVCTDYDKQRLQRQAPPPTSYLVCDAEAVGNLFRENTFDFVFSSNMLEHLPNPEAALAGIHRVLRQDGITIHVLPSVFWKLCHILLFNPNRLVMRIERLFAGRQTTKTVSTLGNNPKVARAARRRWLLPPPHGVSNGTIQELLAFRRSRWKRILERSRFTVVRVMKGPVASGYGFGLDRLRRVLEQLGLASEYVFIAVKAGAVSPHLRYFSVARQLEAEEA
jgi:SAM-dependent methyltransferase